MKNIPSITVDKLNEILDKPNLEKEFRVVFTFVENVRGQKCTIDDLFSKNIEIWNQRFDEVLKKLLSWSVGINLMKWRYYYGQKKTLGMSRLWLYLRRWGAPGELSDMQGT
jgi:hypothetical protein